MQSIGLSMVKGNLSEIDVSADAKVELRSLLWRQLTVRFKSFNECSDVFIARHDCAVRRHHGVVNRVFAPRALLISGPCYS